MQNFSERLSQARKARQMTQAELAKRMHVSRQMVSHWENGRVTPNEETARQLCELLDISEQAEKPQAPARRLSRWLPVAARSAPCVRASPGRSAKAIARSSRRWAWAWRIA